MAAKQHHSTAGGTSPAAFSSVQPCLDVTLSPNRSLSAHGQRWLMGVAAAGLLMPVIPFAFSPIGLVLWPFALVTLAVLYLAIRRNNHDGQLRERLRIWPDLLRVERWEVDGRLLAWEANPYWVRVRLHATRTVTDYLTLSAGGKTIELGAFLTPEERRTLAAEIERVLSRCTT